MKFFPQKCLAIFLAAGITHAFAQDVQVVRIGHVAPLSGGQAQYGKDNENGVRLALEEINALAPVIGGKKISFQLLGEDDAADPRQGTAAAQKLCDANVAGVVGHMNSGTTIPASRIYNACGIPHITPSATSVALTQAGYRTTFRVIANDNALGMGVATYAADALHLHTVALVDDRTAYGQGVTAVFKKVALSRGMQVVSEQFTSDKATDFMAILTAIKAKSPDAIFFGGMGPQAGPMLRQMEQLGLSDTRLLGGDGICTDDLSQLSGGAKTLSNVLCAEGGKALQKMDGGAAWLKRYNARFPGQYQLYSPYTYDAAFVLFDAMKRANSVDPRVYTARLADTNYKGVTNTIAFETNGDLKNPALTFYEFRNGKKTPLN